MLSKYPAGSGRPLDLFLLAVRDAYHARGYLDCSVVSHALFNEATHIVNYSVEIVPGTLYRWAQSVRRRSRRHGSAGSRASGRWRPAMRSTKATSQASRAFAQKTGQGPAKWMQPSSHLRREGRPGHAPGQLHLPLRQGRGERALASCLRQQVSVKPRREHQPSRVPRLCLWSRRSRPERKRAPSKPDRRAKDPDERRSSQRPVRPLF